MCGIIGYIGKKDNASAQVCLEGLKRLEYRGYDSWGISGIANNRIDTVKHVGKVSTSEEIGLNVTTGIGHTRWATHGAIAEKNAHPHSDTQNKIALVHNGIIENYATIKKELESVGDEFKSDTDSEVVVALLAKHYDGSLLETMRKVTPMLKGTYAFAAICKDEPEVIVCATKSAPLIIGKCRESGDIFVSSDTTAFAGRSLDIFYLENDETAMLTHDKMKIVNRFGAELVKKPQPLEVNCQHLSKSGHDHYLLKEILEQPFALTQAISDRIDHNERTAIFDELQVDDEAIINSDQIVILACGSSYHSGCIAKQMIESTAQKRVSVEIASEFRYSKPLVTEKTLVIAISQSGETADTIAAIELAQTMTDHIIALCNVKTSTISRLVASTIDLRAGPEISVCSTKAFTTQLVVLFLLALKFGRLQDLSKERGKELIDHLLSTIGSIYQVIGNREEIERVAKEIYEFENVFFIGRQEMYPTCLEAALKLKEISYIHALGIAAGELKHGTIALITEKALTIALCGNEHTKEKLMSNMMEITSRKGPMLAFANQGCKSIEEIADQVVYLPKCHDMFAPFVYAVATQLLSYSVAKLRKCDIDQPRNLAKSVTVE